MEDVLIYLLRALAVERTQDIIGPVGAGGHEAVIPQLVVDVLLIGLDPAVLVADHTVGHRVLIDPPVGGHPALIAGAPHQGDAVLAQDRVNGGEHAGVVSGAEVDAHRVPLRASHRPHILLQPLYVFHRHGGHLLQHIGGGGDPIVEGHHAHAAFRHPLPVAHADTADAGHAGKTLLQRLHVVLKLVFI